jgi:PAS domain S-box-containing protein
MFKRFTVFIIFIFCFQILANAQNLPLNDEKKINALKLEIENYAKDNNQQKIAELQSKIALIYFNNGFLDLAIDFHESALSLNEKFENKNAQIQINKYLGDIYFQKSDFKTALNYFQTCHKLQKKSSDKYQQGICLYHIGECFFELKQFDKALKNLEEAQEIANELYKFDLMRSVSFLMLEIYKIKGDKKMEELYYEKYLTADKYLKTKEVEGELKQTRSQRDSALIETFRTRQSLSLSQKEILEQENLIAEKEDSLSIARKLAKTQMLQLQLKELTIKQQKTNMQKNRIWFIFLLSTVLGVSLLAALLFFMYRNKKKVNKILSAKNLKIKQQADILESQNIELKKLSLVAAKTNNAILITDAKGNFEWVNESFTRIFGKTFAELIQSTPNIIGPNTPPRVVQIIHKCMEQKETVYYDLHITSSLRADLFVHATLTPILNNLGEIEKLIAIDFDITDLRNANLQIETQKEILELQNKNIKSSIQYAKNIQTASLPNLERFHSRFDSFLIFQPKDIVSGDFYWLAKIDESAECNKFIVGVIDCTGHGVPGAFMSLIGIQLLNEIISNDSQLLPAQIIKLLYEKIIQALNQKDTENNDGMDLGLALVEKLPSGKIKVSFSGAKRPLFVFRNAKKTLETYRGSRRSVGGVKKNMQEVDFETDFLELQHGDCIYLTSDGMTDQPNSNRIRFGTAQWTELLCSIGEENMLSQKEKIQQAYQQHTTQTPQRDDITVLGIKF